MRYVVIGAGAIGGVLAARLAQRSPHPPVLVARGDNARAVAASGLRLRSPDDDVTVDVDLATGPDDVTLRPDDVLVLATKTHQAQAALLEWVDRPVLGADGATVGTAGDLLPVLTALNGVESERLALRLFRRVVGVCVWLPAVHLAPGEVAVRIGPTSGVFVVGAVHSPVTDDDHALLATVAADWEAASFGVHVVDDVARWKYTKLVANLANAVQALAGPSADVPDVVDLLRAEALAVLDAAGIATATPAEEAVWRGDAFRVRPVAGLPDEVGGSSWQSLVRGTGSIESDYLNGEIALLGRLHGVPTPANAAVQGAARRAAAARLAPGSLTPDGLRALVGLR